MEDFTMIRYAILACAAMCSLPVAIRAGFIMTFQQVGSDVVATGSGTFNTSALTNTGGPDFGATFVAPASGYAGVGATTTSSNRDVTWYGMAGPSSFGTGGPKNASSGSGPQVIISGNSGDLEMPNGYTSGSSIIDSATWNNTTIDGLGMTSGTYTWMWGSGPTADSVELVVVPEPSSFILLGVVAAFGFIAYRWRAARAPA
jgi:PEP-CTERM motif